MQYTLGLDIGITSIGWAILDNKNERIADLGVRLFPGAEHPKDGSSLAAPRREARGARRRTRRKAQRMRDVKKLIVAHNILGQQEIDTLFDRPFVLTPWELRALALDRSLSNKELARVLIHVAKHRGFKSNRTLSPEEKTTKASEDGKANASMQANKSLLRDGNEGRGYRTVGEMMMCDPKFAQHKRNKGGDYSNTIARASLEEEIKAIFESQRKFGNSLCHEQLESQYLEIFNRQLPFASGDMIEKLVGFCTHEPTEKRVPKASWTAERFVLLSKIANLSIRSDGKKYELEPEDMQKIARLAYEKSKLTYKQIRTAFKTDKDWTFAELPSRRKEGDDDPEGKTFIELKGFHEFRKAITNTLGKDYWETLISTKPEILDTLAMGLTYRKTDDDIRGYLAEHEIESALIEAVLPLNFTQNLNLSFKAMQKLLPFMEKGLRYDEACVEVGYSQVGKQFSAEGRTLLLPLPDKAEIRNPVVFRAVTQTRKVVNAIIGKYGSPSRVHIELARNLSKPMDERRKIEKMQLENKNDRARLSDDFENLYGRVPTASELLKYRLWKEQGGQCPYSGKAIDVHQAFMSGDGTYAEIDHIIPYSRCFDDSYLNKVLVIGSENRNKQNRTPFEYIGADEQRWHEYVARVDTIIHNKKKAERLKRKDFSEADENEMKERSLGDTRYITRFVSNWIANTLLFADPEIKRPVLTINGQATSLMRWQWGVNALKNRAESDLHHALDACIIAATSPAMVKRMSDHSRKKELGTLRKQQDATAEKIRFPEPWPRFRKEVEARLSPDPAAKIEEFALANYTPEILREVKPIFVSRKPERKASGAAHQETVRSAKYLHEGKTAVKTQLTSIKSKDLDNMVGKERNMDLYEDLKRRLKEHGDKPEKAFQEPFYRRTKDGKQGPLVRSIKLLSSGTSGVPVRDGIASNGGMVRVDVYRKNEKYFLVPYYVDDIAKKKIKRYAIKQGKNEIEWDFVDSSFDFCFSIFRNDLIQVIDCAGKEIFGYYQGTDRSTSTITVLLHDGSSEKRGVGVKTAKSFEKYQVDVLGNYYKVKKEKPPYELA